jgi:2-methylcitrate dehydratase
MLNNAAARDHSLQFIVAAALVTGTLTAAHYHEPIASDPRVMSLVRRVRLVEDPAYTAGYHAPDQRSTGNAIEIVFNDGLRTRRVEALYPGGHPARRDALRPLLTAKFGALTRDSYSDTERAELRDLFFAPERLAELRAADFMSKLARPAAED